MGVFIGGRGRYGGGYRRRGFYGGYYGGGGYMGMGGAESVGATWCCGMVFIITGIILYFAGYVPAIDFYNNAGNNKHSTIFFFF